MIKTKNGKRTQTFWMAIDQYGQTYHGLKHPRKELCEKLGSSHVQKMYVDDKKGNSWWCGYIIAGRWLDLYKVEPLRGATGFRTVVPGKEGAANA